TIEYTGEMWRSANRGDMSLDRLDFSYSIAGNPFTDDNDLDFNSPNPMGTGPVNGNAIANRTTLSKTITFAGEWAAGDTLTLRWTDLDIAGVDDGLSVDDFRMQVTPIPEPSGLIVLGGVAAIVVRRLRRKQNA
ncbi:MAG: hypothetical protein ACRCZF_02620, partial [Gemmataceae bacterium]